MSSSAKAKAKASGGKRAAAAKDPAEAVVSDKRRRERGGMDDSDHEFDRCLACFSLPTPFVFAAFDSPRSVSEAVGSNRGDEGRVFVRNCTSVRREFWFMSAEFSFGGIPCDCMIDSSIHIS
jgi:hypothetical protein